MSSFTPLNFDSSASFCRWFPKNRDDVSYGDSYEQDSLAKEFNILDGNRIPLPNSIELRLDCCSKANDRTKMKCLIHTLLTDINQRKCREGFFGQ